VGACVVVHFIRPYSGKYYRGKTADKGKSSSPEGLGGYVPYVTVVDYLDAYARVRRCRTDCHAEWCISIRSVAVPCCREVIQPHGTGGDMPVIGEPSDPIIAGRLEREVEEAARDLRLIRTTVVKKPCVKDERIAAFQ
jgi:hypothetical protein